MPVTMEDFKEAVEKCNKNVISEDIEKYMVWRSLDPLEMGFQVPCRVKKREVEYFVIDMNIIFGLRKYEYYQANIF